ncbi:MAG: hypothetical protein JEY94_19190 [Melioribacteraceae bacterium]|nr:hypothetical protein [Melioribacteraceae bacterium]
MSTKSIQLLLDTPIIKYIDKDGNLRLVSIEEPLEQFKHITHNKVIYRLFGKDIIDRYGLRIPNMIGIITRKVIEDFDGDAESDIISGLTKVGEYRNKSNIPCQVWINEEIAEGVEFNPPSFIIQEQIQVEKKRDRRRN